MSEIKTTPVPFLSFEGGINTNTSLVDMAANEAEDIINCDLTNEKTVSRRKSFDFIGEKSGGGFYFDTDISYENSTQYQDIAPSCASFIVPDTSSEQKHFIVAHIGDELRVWDIEDWLNLKEEPSQIVNLGSSISNDARWYKTKYDTDRNKLFLLNRGIDPGYVYMNTSNKLEYVPITVFVRDLDNEPDSQVNNNDKSYLCIKAHTSSANNEPGTGDNWREYWVLYGPSLDGGVSWASSTSYTTNISTLSQEYSTICFAAGRLWISGILDDPSKVYFSQQVTDDLQYGRMYQFADPLNEDDNVKVETDGGSLIINGADKILRIHEYKNGVMVFASNGVWYISGKSGASFNAVDFDTEKVSSDGIIGEEAAVNVEDKLIYFGYGGAYVLVRDEIYYTLKTQIISDKIENLWSSIPLRNRKSSKAIYNTSNKRLYLFTNFNSYVWQKNRNPEYQATHYRDALVLNTSTGAWWKYSLSEDDIGDKVAIGDVITFASPSYSTPYIVDNNNNHITDSSTGEYLISYSSPDVDEFVNLCIFMKKDAGSAKVAFGSMDGNKFIDFYYNNQSDDVVSLSGDDVINSNGDNIITGIDAESYDCTYLSAFHTFKELRHKKRNNRVVFAFKRTETGLFNDDNEDLTASGCYFTPLYNWKNVSVSTPVQVYRPDTWTTGYYNGKRPDSDVVYVKERVKGKGHSVQFKFESDENKDFELIGFQADIMTSERI